MAVMLIADFPGSTHAEQQAMHDQVADLVRRQDGFLFHASGPTRDGWRIHEIWETREQLDHWLHTQVFPRQPSDAPTPDVEVMPIVFAVAPHAER